ncbi:MAG: PIG-L family deacetylase [Candidatus Aminicenantes bacterium]|nr:PIG-L family deacetylase [Candidatus Aminicenantes bacterium]
MKFNRPNASILIPDGRPVEEAFRRVTHLGVGAHQDDLEIMAFHGIIRCFRQPDDWFGAIVCTDGSGSPRQGPYASCSNGQMAAIRRREQEKAATIGDYGLLVQLNYTSQDVKDVADTGLRDDLVAILKAAKPSVVYTHNPADKHETHLAVSLTALRALRALPRPERPGRVYGCEVWRDLDWLDDRDKTVLDVGGHENLAAALVGIYDSQIAGGKRYDLAALGRRRANASFFQSHETDKAEGLWFALDLTPLVQDDGLDVADFVLARVDRFREAVAANIRKYRGA